MESAGDQLSAALLAAVAYLLDWCGRPHRKLFHYVRRSETYVRRSETAHPEPVSADPNGAVAVYSQPGEDWDAAGFEAFLRGSSSQFVMWRRQGARKLENVPQLWDDPRTFALALQVHFRVVSQTRSKSMAAHPCSHRAMPQAAMPRMRSTKLF